MKPERMTAREGVVSVVIPVYNGEALLAAAIDSVLEQDYRPIEIIVVDDGSTDRSAAVASAYSAVRCIRQENRGLAAARNVGLREASGEFVVFCDHDDLLLPNALARGVDHLRAHPDCAFAFGHFVRVDHEGAPIETPDPPAPTDDPYRELLRRRDFVIAVPASVTYRRAVFERFAAFDGSLRACEDLELYLRIARTSAICQFPEPVAAYRRHPGSMSADPALMLRSALTVLERERPITASNPDLEVALAEGRRFWQDYYGGRLGRRARRDLRAGHVGRGFRRLATLARHHPRGLLPGRMSG